MSAHKKRPFHACSLIFFSGWIGSTSAHDMFDKKGDSKARESALTWAALHLQTPLWGEVQAPVHKTFAPPGVSSNAFSTKNGTGVTYPVPVYVRMGGRGDTTPTKCMPNGSTLGLGNPRKKATATDNQDAVSGSGVARFWEKAANRDTFSKKNCTFFHVLVTVFHHT
jgi:hypothetical protein